MAGGGGAPVTSVRDPLQWPEGRVVPRGCVGRAKANAGEKRKIKQKDKTVIKVNVKKRRKTT